MNKKLNEKEKENNRLETKYFKALEVFKDEKEIIIKQYESIISK
jgi:hypothetical protein